MVYLSTDESRWGQIKKMLPNPYKAEFEDYMRTLHILYSYEGKCPRDKVEEGFGNWYKRVENYVRVLEEESSKGGEHEANEKM